MTWVRTILPPIPSCSTGWPRSFRRSGYDVKHLIRLITATRAYNASSVTRERGRERGGSVQRDAASADVAGAAFRLAADGDPRPRGRQRRPTATRSAKTGRRQFLFAFGNDEGDEATSFQGTIPQALMMMNGELMRAALSGKPGSFLADLHRSRRRHQPQPELYMVNQIYLAALSRYPTAKEAQQAGHYLTAYPDTLQVLQDLFWALLNSNEFILIH